MLPSVEYNGSTQSADIVTESNLLNLLGLKIGVPYYWEIREDQRIFQITDFDPNTNEFKGTYSYITGRDKGSVANIKGKISESKLRFQSEYGHTYELTYYGGTKEFKDFSNSGKDEIVIYLD